MAETPHARRNLHLPNIDLAIHTDASEIGWGATDGNNPSGGKWIREKEKLH